MISLRQATTADFEAIWQIFREITDTYPDDSTCTPDEAQQLWLGKGVFTVVASTDENVVGAYKLAPNMPGRGAHVANGSYIVAADYRGRGIGRLLVEHSLREAKRAGYHAIQFNFVISTNDAAVNLYQSLGFQTLATLPKAYRHGTLGYVDVYVMYRSLEHEA